MRFLFTIIPEFDLEMQFTRKHLERVPMDKLDFKIHDKSMALGWLATFMTILPTWGTLTLTTDSFDVAAPSGGPTPEIARTRKDLIVTFDKNVSDLRSNLMDVSEGKLLENWTLMASGKVFFSQPRWLVFRTFFLNHMIHHRAQLGVYLRLIGVPVPAVYNDSADESGGIFRD